MSEIVYIVEQGGLYSDITMVNRVYETKRLAKEEARMDGFRWSREEDLFLNDDRHLCHKIFEETVHGRTKK